jgi:DNA-binding beta-propeller fold protein YncE
MMIGGPGAKGPDSNNTNGGSNGTPQFYLPADITVDPATNRMFVSDGYGNRRVVIADAATGKYLGHFGAYGNNPVDDKAAADAGPWMNDFTKGNMKPAFFRNPVHCARLSKDGLIYVCDRGNNRVQVFNGRDPNLGKPCANAAGEAGKCGFVKEKFVAVKTLAPPLPGSAVSMNFSTDAQQSCLYVGDNTNQTIYVLKRDTLEELGRLGRSGREAGEFHWLHQVGVDSRGNLYTGEVDTGKRLQKFIRYGADGCSGTGRTAVGELLP